MEGLLFSEEKEEKSIKERGAGEKFRGVEEGDAAVHLECNVLYEKGVN